MWTDVGYCRRITFMKAPTNPLAPLRSVVPVLLGLVAASGCAHPAQDYLEGRWLGSRVENVDDDVMPAVTGWVRGTSFEFVGSQVTVAIPAEEPRTGDYEILHSEAFDLVIAVHDDAEAIYEARFEREDDELRWDIGGGRAVVLTKER